MYGREYANWTQGAGAIAGTLRRLPGSFERSEATIRERLAETQRETATLEALTGRNAAFADGSE